VELEEAGGPGIVMSAFDFSKYGVLALDADPRSLARAKAIYAHKGLTHFCPSLKAEDAWQIVKTLKPHLMLADLGLGDRCIQFIRDVRMCEGGQYSELPVIALTTQPDPIVIRQACDAGIEGVLRKPIDPVRLLQITRLALTEPKRFISVPHYFGPERRARSEEPFGGYDRRIKHKKSDPFVSSLSAEKVVLRDPAEVKLTAADKAVKRAMSQHRLWIDTGGKEGSQMAMKKADLRRMKMLNAELSRVQLPQGDFRGIACRKTDFSKSNLRRALFIEAKLVECDMSMTRLSQANMSRAKMKFTSLRGADLTKANLFGAHFNFCDMSAANLNGANLVEANLSSVRGLRASQLANAQIDRTTKLPKELAS